MQFHIPGYNYCGPGTKDFSKKPKNKLDKLCRDHDLAYDRIGSSAYYLSSAADREFEVKAYNEGILGKGISKVFSAKRLFAESVGLPDAKENLRKKRKMNVRTSRTNRKFKRVGRNYRRRRNLRKKRTTRVRRVSRRQRYRKKAMSLALRVKGQPTNEHRALGTGAITASINSCSYGVAALLTGTFMDEMATNTQVLDVSAGNLVPTTVDLTATGITGQRHQIYFTEAATFLNLRNNSTADAKVVFYEISSIKNNTDGPGTNMYSGWNDKYGTSYANLVDVDLMTYPHDSTNFKQYFKILNKKTVKLRSGDEFTYGMKARPYLYDIEAHKEDPNLVGLRGATKYIVWRVEGSLEHDTSSTGQVRVAPCAIDFIQKTAVRWKYVNPHRGTALAYGTAQSFGTVISGEFAVPAGRKMETYEV